MEESTYEAIFIGVYVFIFIIAVSVTIYLFLGINDLAENTYEYANRMTGGSVITNAEAPRWRLMSASEVLSFVSNYRFMDNYADSAEAYNSSEFKVKVILSDNRSNISISDNQTDTLTISNYKDLLNAIDYNAKYILKYEKLVEKVDEYNIPVSKTSYITIQKATDAEINATF